jgi:hypothetical protein
MLAISTASSDSENRFFLYRKSSFAHENDVTCTLLVVSCHDAHNKESSRINFLLLLYVDDLYTNPSLVVCFTVLHIARHFSSCFTIGGRTSRQTTTITAPLLCLRCPPICTLFVKRLACMKSLLKRTTNVVPHAEAEFVGLAVAAFGARVILTKVLVT